MAYVNVAEWSPRHVAEWLRGLDDIVQPYVQFFLNNDINGCHLLTLASDDLIHLNVVKIGHQQIILEAVELLRQLHYNLTSENLQSLALKLGCKARSLCNSLKQLNTSIDNKKRLVSTETLSLVSDILGLVKILISWLDRYPFEGQDQYKALRKIILQHSIELASTAQRDQFAEKPHEVIQNSCANIAEHCDTIVQKFNDSLIIQPASLKVASVKKRSDEDLGIHIHSSYSGIHIIGAVKFQSPAYRCGKVSEGDEIIQVNYQTVVGWQLKNLVCATREHPSEIHLTLKKRPHHSSVLEEVITIWPYRIPSKRTAFRKMNKWTKPSSHLPVSVYSPPGSSKEMNGYQDNCSDRLYPLDGIGKPFIQQKNFTAALKRRPRVNRRATIDSIPNFPQNLPVNTTELKNNVKVIKNGEASNIKEKYATYNPNKTGNTNCNSTIVQPIACKFGSTDSDKWKRKKEGEMQNAVDKKTPVIKYLETNQEPLINHSDISNADSLVKRCNPKQCQSMSPEKLHSSTDVQQYSSVAHPNPFQNCISTDKQKDSLLVVKNEENSRESIRISEEKIYEVQAAEIIKDSPKEKSIIESKSLTEKEEEVQNSPESEEKMGIAKFQVVSLPSPGANTRTFTRQNLGELKVQTSIDVQLDSSAKLKENGSGSTTDLSGQSDTSLEEIDSLGQNPKSNIKLTGINEEPSKVGKTVNHPKNGLLGQVDYRKVKNIQIRSQRRFTADQATLPKDWEKILKLSECSAFRPVSGRSLSCLDVSQMGNDFGTVSHSNYINSIQEEGVSRKETLKNTHMQPKYVYSPKTNSQPTNYICSLDRKSVPTKCVNGSIADKHDTSTSGYVAKIAECFNTLSKKEIQHQQQQMCKMNEPSVFPVTTGHLYQPISSYAMITKPKPLRGDQLLKFRYQDFSNLRSSTYSKSCYAPQKQSEESTNHDFKKDHSKLLRTATSEEIQNMYTSYGNTGRSFENMYSYGNITQNTILKEEVKVNGLNCEKQKISGSSLNLVIKNTDGKEQDSELAHKLKSLIFGEKERNKTTEKLVACPLIPHFSSLANSRVSAAVQTDSILNDSFNFEDSCLNTSFASQDSFNENGNVFYNKPIQNMSDESIVYGSNSSLNSSTSSGSHYYYVETQIRPELTISLPVITQEDTVDATRNSHLPRMGVAAMLGKKRTVSYGSSDSGSGETIRNEKVKESTQKQKPFLGHGIPIDV